MPIVESSKSDGSKPRVHQVSSGAISKKDRATSVEKISSTSHEAVSVGQGVQSAASSASATSASADDVVGTEGTVVPSRDPVDPEAASDSSAIEGASSSESADDSSGNGSDDSSSNDVAETRDADADAINAPQGAVLYSVPKAGCFKCGHFITEMVEVQTKCHFSQGYGPGEPGEMCPAREIQIRVAVPKEKIATNLAKYTLSGDIEGYNRVSNNLIEASRSGKVTATEFREIKAREAALVTEIGAQQAEAAHVSSKKKKSKDKARKSDEKESKPTSKDRSERRKKKKHKSRE